jgi:hypothetical protein
VVEAAEFVAVQPALAAEFVELGHRAILAAKSSDP